MSSLTLLVLADEARHLASSLRDLSTLGLVTPFVWTSPGDPGADNDVTVVEEGAARRSTLDREVATLDPSRIRVVVVSFCEQPESAERTVDTATSLLSTLPPSTRRVHLLLPPAAGLTSQPVGRGGWVNIVVSPEDGYRPSAPHERWSDDIGAAGEGRRVAFTIAALAGLLRDHPDTWPDEVPTPSVPTYRVARVYYRRLDGRSVEHAVHVQLFDIAEALPRVWTERGQGEHHASSTEAATAMAKRWWGVARSEFLTARATLPEPEVREVGVWAALKLFLGYLLAALKNAPGAWARSLVRRSEERLERAVGGHIFSDDSAYRVVINRGRGRRPGEPDLGEALRVLDEGLPSSTPRARPGQHAWKSLVEGALVLGDAAGGSGSMAFQEESRVLTVASLDDIVTPVESRYRVRSAGLRHHLSVTTVKSSDFLGMVSLQRELQALVNEPRVGSDAGTEARALKGWWEDQATSYAARTSQALGQAHLAALKEIDTVSGDLQLGEEELAREVDALAVSQKRSRRWTVLWVALGLVLTAVFLTMGFLGVILLGLASVIAAACLIGGLVAAFATFYRNQQRLFQLLYRIDRSAELAPLLKQNLAAAVRDARTTIDAYELHQRWVRTLRLFLQDPFGARALPAESDVELASTMPLAAAVGMGQVNEVLVAREVHQLQRRFFPRGWLHRAWQRYLDALPHHLGVAGVHLTSGADILAQQGGDATTLLARIAATVEEQGPPPEVGDQSWAEALGQLQAAVAQGRELFPQVSVLGRPGTLPRADFERRFEDGEQPVSFAPTLFDAQAIVEGLNDPIDTWTDRSETGLSESRLRVTYSAAMPPERLVAYRGDEPEPETDIDRGITF